MKLPRKGILIRLGIYLPIIGFLVWRAFFSGPQTPEPADEEVPPGKFKVIEMTSEEAKAMGLEIPEQPDEPAAAPSKAADAPQ